MKWLIFTAPAGSQLLLVYRILSGGLAKRYPAFTTWMAFSGSTTVGLQLYAAQQIPGYRTAWMVQRILLTALQFLTLVELTRRILDHYPGLRRVSSSALLGVLLATSIVAVAGESMDRPLQLAMLMQAAWNLATMVFVIIVVGLATYLDPHRRRNVILHERLFLANTLMTVIGSVIGMKYAQVGTWLGALAGIILPLLWLQMDLAGEVDTRTPAIARDGATIAETEDRLRRLERLVTRLDG